jgi:hypothetical protein
VVGLAVSFFAWRVRAASTVAHAARETLGASAKLLDALVADEAAVRRAQLALYDAISALVKAGRDTKVERDAGIETGPLDSRALEVLQFGLEVLAATLAAQGHAPAAPPVQVLRNRLAELSRA